jgi:hypothetical protein
MGRAPIGMCSSCYRWSRFPLKENQIDPSMGIYHLGAFDRESRNIEAAQLKAQLQSPESPRHAATPRGEKHVPVIIWSQRP